MEVISICELSNSHAQDTFLEVKEMANSFMKDFNEAKTVSEKIEIANAIRLQRAIAINAGQLAVNAQKVSTDANESNLKYGGLIPGRHEKNANKYR